MPGPGTAYGISTTVPLPFEQALGRTREALASEGFGVLTEIDVAGTLKKKLDVEFRPYVILGACNPPLAHRALSAELDIGLLLPCNVIVYEREAGTSTVAAMAPMAAMALVDNRDVMEVAKAADAKLRSALANLEQDAGAAER